MKQCVCQRDSDMGVLDSEYKNREFLFFQRSQGRSVELLADISHQNEAF